MGEPLRRPIVIGRPGMVASPHYLASVTGLEMLNRGGSAIDAAIAMNAVLAVVAPPNCGLGGDALWIIHDGARGEVRGLNGSGWAGQKRPPEGLQSPAAATVPGAVDSWGEAHGRYGRLPWDQLLQPAIHMANEGVAVSESLVRWIASSRDTLIRSREAAKRFLPNGESLQRGQALRQPDLGASLQALSRDGPRVFYEGALADRMLEALGPSGALTAEDLSAFRSEWVEPITGDFRGYSILQLPPNSQGGATLVAMDYIEARRPDPLDLASPTDIALVVKGFLEGMRARSTWGDPRINLDPTNKAKTVHPAPLAETDTVAMVALDQWGTGVSLLESIYFAFGTGLMAGGFFLHNRGAYFERSGPNAWAPRKRPLHTLMPGLIMREGRLQGLIGTMGGDGQFQTQVQLLLRVIDGRAPAQVAIEAPRCLFGRFIKGDPETSLFLEIDPGKDGDSVATAIQAATGLPVARTDRWDDRFGHAHMIWRTEDAFWEVATDPRADGLALVAAR